MTFAPPVPASPRFPSAPGWMPVRSIETFVRVLLTYASVMACFSVPVLTVRSLLPASNQLPWIAGAVSSLAILAILWSGRRRLATWFTRVSGAASQVSDLSWVALCLSAGILMRLVWIAAVPGTPASDGATYIILARKLIAGDPYMIDGTRAYWPPGYPLFLTPWLALINNDRLAIVVSNVALFLVGAMGVWKLARLTTAPGSARIGLLLFTLWPNLAFQAGMPEKEQVLVALLPWILVLSLVRDSAEIPLWRTFLAGVVLGAATLVQPILQLFPAVLLCYWFICCRRVVVPLRMTVVTILGMMIVIAPWTLRNYVVFDRFVLISTNGGAGLYGANNAAANGGYLQLQHWPDDLMRMPELEADREAKRRAASWIIANPSRFLALAFEKNILFMGDDAVGPYQTIKRGKGSSSDLTYIVTKGVSNLYWLAGWSLMLGGLLVTWTRRRRIESGLLLIPFTFLYFFLIHSVVESAGKYHVLTIGVLSVLIPMLLETSRQNESDHELPWPDFHQAVSRA